MSPDNFAANLDKINRAKLGNSTEFLFQVNGTTSNLGLSIVKKLKDDGFPSLAVSRIKIERSSSIWMAVKIEIYNESVSYRDKTIIGYANFNAGMEVIAVYPFREVAYIEKQTTDVELLNGWEVRNYFVLEKIGNLVNVNFIIHKGVRDHGTIIFVLPPEYRPKASISVPTPYTGIATSTISFGFNGNVIIYGWHESTDGYFIVSASYVVD